MATSVTTIYNIDEAIDRKFIVTKTIGSNQAKAGTLVHIMDARQDSKGIHVDYRVTSSGQDFTIRFENLKQFTSWATLDTFIARYYDFLSAKDLQYYIKVTNRTFASFCVPIIAVALVIIWIIAIAAIGSTTGIIVGAILSVIAIGVTVFIYTSQKNNFMVKLYGKVSTGAWGIALK